MLPPTVSKWLLLIAAIYVAGAIAGLGLTWINNNLMSDTPRGDYLFWANFIGSIAALVAGLMTLVVGLIKKVHR